jgi:hypothetical protein
MPGKPVPLPDSPEALVACLATFASASWAISVDSHANRNKSSTHVANQCDPRPAHAYQR